MIGCPYTAHSPIWRARRPSLYCPHHISRSASCRTRNKCCTHPSDANDRIPGYLLDRTRAPIRAAFIFRLLLMSNVPPITHRSTGATLWPSTAPSWSDGRVVLVGNAPRPHQHSRRSWARHHHSGARHVLPPPLFSTFHADARGLSGSWVPPRFGAPPRSGVRRDLGPP